MKKIIFLLFISTICFGQNEVDSLSYYYNKGEYKKALLFGEKLELNPDIIKNKLNLLSVKSNNGVMYYQIGDFFLAKNKFEEALFLANIESGISNLEIAIIKKLTARNLKELQEFSKASVLINESLDYFKLKKNENPGDYADALRVLGDIHKSNGEIFKAISVLKESSSIFKKVFGENEFYSASLNSLGNCYFLIEDYNNAEICFTKSIEIYKKIRYGSTDYALSLASLADVHIVKKQYLIAEDLLFKANEILKSDNLNIAKQIVIYNKLGYLYIVAEMFDDAELIIKTNVDLIKKVYGLKHSNLISNENNLAYVYFKKKKYEEAKEIYLEILNKNSQLEYKEFSTINNLALIYTELNNINEAEKLYIDAIKKIEKSIFNNSKNHFTLLENCILFYLKYDKADLAKKYFIKYITISNNSIYKFISFFTENDIINYINYENQSLYLKNSFLFLKPNSYPEINTASYDNQLLLKNLTLRNQQRIKNSIAQSNNTELKEKYEQFIANKRYLTKQEELPLLERASNYETIKNTTENFEKDITRLSSDFADAKKTLAISWQDIQQKLKPNEVVIDLVSYKYYNKKWTDSIMYGAFVFTKNSKFPKYIHLFEEKELLNITSASFSSQDPKATFNALYANQSLTNLFLTPFKKELDHATTIYITPSGLTHQLNFEALPLENNLTLGKKYTLHVLNAASELINMKSTSISGIPNLECFLYGGIDFDKLEFNAEATADISSEQQTMLENEQRSGIKEFGYLKGTKQEVEQIATKTKAANFVTHLLQDRNATEESLKQLDGYKKPFVLHLATHGFFFPNAIKEEKNEAFNFEQKKNYYRASEDPMLRSGLVFAGANKTWAQKNTSLQKDDGIVTAKEISELDLSQCQLVVLSACETGLGTINGSEGVFGLQRAFKMAGVKNIIMSLWKVPDAQTAELFDIFYDAILIGKSIKEAFVNAQNQMQMKYEPYYWAGFILLE